MAEEPAKPDVPDASSVSPPAAHVTRAQTDPSDPAPPEQERPAERAAPDASESNAAERPLLPQQPLGGARQPSQRLLVLGVAFLVPCAVIALSLYFIVRGGAVRQIEPAPSSVVAAPPSPSPVSTSDASTELDSDEPGAAPEVVGRGPVTLENPEGPVVLAPGFEDEGMDDEPSPNKPSAPKRFATVQEAAAGSCSTESVDGLSRQIIEQARCLKPKDFVALPKRPNLMMAPNVYPYLELSARDALLRALDAHKKQPMTINSCLRTVAQQYLVSRWSLSKTCGVQLATHPGESNHEIGTALDIKEAGTWRPALEAEDFRWLGASDRVHFDYKGPSAATRTATDVLAFQKLWNRNHKDDPINETGRYDSATEQRLKKSPPAGFALGASCIRPGGR